MCEDRRGHRGTHAVYVGSLGLISGIIFSFSFMLSAEAGFPNQTQSSQTNAWPRFTGDPVSVF